MYYTDFILYFSLEETYVVTVMCKSTFCSSIKHSFCQYSYYSTIEDSAVVFTLLSFVIRKCTATHQHSPV